MVEGNWRGGFAVGLTVGVGSIAALVLWVFSVNYCPNAPCYYQSAPDQSEAYNQRWFPIPWNPNSTLQPKPEFAEGSPKKHEYYDLQAQENMARATNLIAWASIATLVTSVLGVWLLVSNLAEVGKTNRLMLDQFTAQNPPKFMIKQICIDLAGWFTDEKPGEFFIFNQGPTDAVIHSSNIVSYVGAKPPAGRPFEHCPHANEFFKKDEIVPAGKGYWKKITSEGTMANRADIIKAMDTKEKDTNFYLIGRIHFNDARSSKAGWNRHMVFCRKYDPATGRFVETSDSDYEYHT